MHIRRSSRTPGAENRLSNKLLKNKEELLKDLCFVKSWGFNVEHPDLTVYFFERAVIMATKEKVQKPRFVIADLVKEVRSGKMTDAIFKGKMKKHYTEKSRKADWIEMRTTKLLRRAHRKHRVKK